MKIFLNASSPRLFKNESKRLINLPIILTFNNNILYGDLIMELYGLKLHILTSITGGFILRQSDKWPNVIKIWVFLLLFAFFYLILSFDFKMFLILLLAGLLALFVIIIQLIVIWFNSMLDDSIQVSSSSGEIESQQTSSIPSKISGPLWESRNILFNERIPMDERAYQLIKKGFDADEVFRLIELIRDGTVTKDTKDHAPVRRVKTNLIVLCGQNVNIHFDRDSLNRTFSKPRNIGHLFSSAILTFFLAIFLTGIREMNPPYITWYISLICASSIFSLLLPPPTDPYATNFNDTYISYTRSACAVGMTGVVFLMQILKIILPKSTYIPQINLNIYWPPILSVLSWLAYCLFLFYPILILVGLMGHPITSLHFIVETVNKYLFGISGSPSFKKAAIDFLWSLLMVIFVALFMLIGNHPVTVGVSILVVTFFIQFSIADNCQTFMKKHLLTAIIAAVVSASTSLINWVITDTIMKFLMNGIVIVNFVFDVAFPYLTTHQNYIFVYGRMIPMDFFIKYWHFITNFITAPSFISCALVNDKKLYETVNNRTLFAFFSALLILNGLRIAQTLPHIFCMSAAMTMLLFQYDLDLPTSSVSLLLSLLISRKIVKIYRLTSLWYKWRKLPNGIFQDPYLSTKEFVGSVLMSYIICMIPQPFTALSFPSYSWSLITGAPMLIINGYQFLFGFFPPRPNLFYDYTPQHLELRDEITKEMIDSPIEAPIYYSLTKTLEDKLGKMVKDGKLGLITDDTFFLMVAGDLMAIVHIIAVEANKVYFQIRGLEYVEQTLCHGGELSKLSQIIQEHTNFGNIGHAFSFKFSMFELRVLNSTLEMIDVDKIDFDSAVLPTVGRSALAWELKSLVYCILRCFKENLNPPDAPEGHYDGIVPHLSENHMSFINFVAEKYDLEVTDFLMKRLWVIIHTIHSIIIERGGRINSEKMYELFEGRIEINEKAKPDEEILLKSLRFSVSVLLMVSSLLAPTSDNFEELFRFFEDTFESYHNLPLRSPEIEHAMKELDLPVISMWSNQDNYYIVRFSKTEKDWTFFELSSESIRGFWANEIRSILFFAMSSRERNSIQFNIHSLRNITNQSCNQPVGYPAYVSPIIGSYSDYF